MCWFSFLSYVFIKWESLEKSGARPLKIFKDGLNMFAPICCCWVVQLCPALCHSMDCSTPRFRVLHYLPEPAQTHVQWVSDAIQSSHPLLSPSPLALNLSQHKGLFQLSQLFASGGQSIGASASVLPMNIQHSRYYTLRLKCLFFMFFYVLSMWRYYMY